MYSHLILYCLYPRTYLHDCQALQDAEQEQEDPAPLEDAAADGEDAAADGEDAEADGSDDEDESEDEENSIDATTLVLGQSPPPEIPEIEPGEHDDSTDNESRSPWEVTGETRAFKDMKREMEGRGEEWPPCYDSDSDSNVEPSDNEDMVPNVPASASGHIHDGLNVADLVVPPLPPSPTSPCEHYVTPPSKRSLDVPTSSMKTQRVQDSFKVKVEAGVKDKEEPAITEVTWI